MFWNHLATGNWNTDNMEPLSTQRAIVQSAFHEKVPAGGAGSGAFRGESLLAGGLKGCYWWKTEWRTRELHCYIQTENIKQLRVACSECTFTVYCGCCDNVLHWITLKWSEHMKAYCLLSVQWLWKKMRSGWLVATRHSPRNLAHAHISHS
jgi:hypothetical protein